VKFLLENYGVPTSGENNGDSPVCPRISPHFRTEVDEPNSTSATVTSTGCPGTGEPIWITSYTNDALDNLTQVVQNGSHTRTFTYDSLSRLITAANPENGTITYTYNPDGTVLTKKDARLITASYTYDALHRETGVTYSNGDPALTFTYDETNCLSLTACQNIGHRTSMTDGAGSEAWAYQVDPANFRSVHQERRTTNSSPSNITKTTTYYLNLAGNVTQLVYPTVRTVNYTYDAADRPSAAADSANGITYATDWKTPGAGCLANAVCYTPQGSVYNMSIGQTTSYTGFNLSETFNNRLQPNEIKAGTALDLSYTFVDPVSLKNDGQAYKITNNLAGGRSQTFTYDQLNRITSAGTSITTGSACWGYQYTYDAWGNLLSQAGWTPTYNACTQTNMAGVTADGNNHVSGLSYDTSGNTLNDGTNTYTWNGESQLKTAAGVTYSYDGDGRRAAKVGSKLYWYGSGGEILSETDAAGTPRNDYIFFGGKRVAMVPATGSALFYAGDMLGTSRVIVQSNGTLCYDADFVPFGGEKTQLNTCPQSYKFTGKERDAESGLDNFGKRYDASNLGRFMTPDSFYKDSHVGDPQSWNEYAYARNNPLRYVDPTGENATIVSNCRMIFMEAVCDVTISASIAIYAAPGSRLTQEQLNAAATTIQNSIHDGWTGSFSQDGVTINVTTQVSVSVAESQDAAMSSGKQNVIGMTNGPITMSDGTLKGAYVNPKSFMGMLTGAPDTGMMDINNADNYAKHEFTHLLGTLNKPGAVLSNTDPAMRPGSATGQDYGWGIREAISGVNSWVHAPDRQPMRYGEEWEKPSAYSDTTTVGAPWHWWK
jgi:RHS repeat-associated protein